MNLNSLECPKCGAPFDIPETSRPTMECPYCGNVVAIPPELRSSPSPEPGAPHWQASSGFGGIAGVGELARLGEIRSLVQRGQKIEAIKLWREVTGMGLKDAKEAVEAIERGEPVSITNRVQTFTPAQQATVDAVVKAVPKAAAAVSIGGVVFTLLILSVTICLPLGILLFTIDNPVADMLRGANPLAFAAPVLTFGSEGSGQGMFEDARAIAVDGQGYVYVAEFDTGRIQRFDSEGNFQNLWLIPPPENRNDVYVPALAAGSDGRVYVVANGEVLFYDGQTGERLGSVELNRAEPGHTVYVDDLVLSSDEKLVMVYSGDTILVNDKAGNFVTEIPDAISSVTKDSELDGAIAVDGLGNFFLLGSFNDTVVRYAPDGTYNTRFGSDGDKPGQFSAVLGIAVDPYGRVFVSDFDGIEVFDSDGLFLAHFNLNGVAYGLAFDREGGLWVTTSHKKVIHFKIKPPEN